MDSIIINTLIVALLCFTFYYIYLSRETFQTTAVGGATILTSQRLNLSIKGNLIDMPYKAWDYVIFKLVNRQPLTLYKNPAQIILDPKDYNDYGQSLTSSKLPKGVFCILTSPQKAPDYQCGFDWTNRKIGFVDRVESNLIKAVLFGYRTHAKVTPIGLDQVDKLNALFNDIDLLLLYIVPKSPLAKLIASQDVALLDWKDIDMERLRISYPGLEKENILIDDLFGLNRRVQNKNKVITFLTTQLLLVNMPTAMVTNVAPTAAERTAANATNAAVTDAVYNSRLNIAETFITTLKLSKEYTDADFKCFGDETIRSKLLCESAYDTEGEPKKTSNVWDKKCLTNKDCPFYLANKNYSNQRGGCLKDGTCEMPLGVLRVAYKKYLDKDPYAPFCYQCKNPKSPMCCEDQERLVELQRKNPNATYTSLKSADFVFPSDTDARKEAKLPTTIFLPE